MSKKSLYFPHDYHARRDFKLRRLVAIEGQAGKGIYWDLIEMLYEEGGKIEMANIDLIADEVKTDIETLKRIIENYGLFEHDDKYFWSNAVNTRMIMMAEQSEKARQNAEKRWSKVALEGEEKPKKAKKSKEYSPLPQVDDDYEPPIVDLGSITKEP